MTLRRISTLFAALVPAFALSAQDEREMNTPTSWAWYYGVDATTLSNSVASGNRITDLEVESVSPLRFTAALVRNSGAYASGFWWYYGLTAAQVTSYLNTNTARLIDLEPYDDGGATRFACVMVPNTGGNAKSWWWYWGTTPAVISSAMSTNGARLVDFDSYEIGSSTYYSAVMIANTGADYRNFAWYYNVPVSTVQASVNTGRRVYDLEQRSNGNYNAILITDPTPQHWTWWYGLDAAQVSWTYQQYGHRIYDLQSYFVGGQRRFAFCTINNSNGLTTQAGDLMRGSTDGTVGCYLKQINGSELAGLNEGTQFEPASTMKTLHHVHAMRRVLLGAISLNAPVNVFTAMSGSCPVDSGAVSETLTTVLRKMMEQSDNARTQAVAALFGTGNINNTAVALGMDETSLNHRLGCGAAAISNPNQITLYDLGVLHTQVANGYLGSFRGEFYEHMLNGLSWAGIDTVIDQEAAALGMTAPALAAFKAYMEVADKGGSYTLISSGVTHEHRTGFGYVKIPFVTGGQVQDREYAVGAFVNDASNGTDASDAVNGAIAAMLRPTLRSALQSWDVTALAVSYGAGCGGLGQVASGLPRIGSSVGFNASGAEANKFAVMLVGFSNTFSGSNPLPMSLLPFGAPGCFALCDIAGTLSTVTNGSGQASRTMAIPGNPIYLDDQFFTQWYVLGTAIRTSNGIRCVIGS